MSIQVADHIAVVVLRAVLLRIKIAILGFETNGILRQ